MHGGRLGDKNVASCRLKFSACKANRTTDNSGSLAVVPIANVIPTVRPRLAHRPCRPRRSIPILRTPPHHHRVYRLQRLDPSAPIHCRSQGPPTLTALSQTVCPDQPRRGAVRKSIKPILELLNLGDLAWLAVATAIPGRDRQSRRRSCRGTREGSAASPIIFCILDD